jgi:hypothetical protein
MEKVWIFTFSSNKILRKRDCAAKIEQANTLSFLVPNSEPGSPAIAFMHTTVIFLLYLHDLYYTLYISVKRTLILSMLLKLKL